MLSELFAMSARPKQKYVAFLRGINVGGKKPIRMKQLAEVLTAAGLGNVRTFIASGNVIFEASAKDPARIARKIEMDSYLLGKPHV